MSTQRFHSILSMVLLPALFSMPALADSQARIVRLSDVQGGVQIDKNSGLGFENAFDNLPIVQGTQLHTRENGRAEVEFEDGSTLRVTPNTTVIFSTLGLSDAGKRISAVNLQAGRAYVNWLGKSGDQLTLNFSREKVVLAQPVHFRAAVSPTLAEVASFKNELEVTTPSGAVKVEKKKIVTFDANDNDKASVAKSFERDPYDDWDDKATSYHDQYAKNNPTPYGYGVSDLSYYGSYSNVAGYGTLWQPFFAGAGWNPYMDGAWSWYPGAGYMWASAYPWGWMPYYYGNWAFVPGFGWGWQPGGFNTWHGGIHYVGAVASSFHAPAAPTGSVRTVSIGKGGGGLALATIPETMVVHNGSAGLGIPRGSFGSLHHVNGLAAKNGSVELHAVPTFAGYSGTPGGFGGGRPSFGEAGHASVSSSGHASGGGGHAGH